MENYSYSSYPDSRDSSPRSREIDCENQSWEEPPSSNYKVKFMCSYNGKIQPRPHDNQLAYVGGETKILAVDRSIKFNAIKSKLSSICNDADLCFKYQLPGEDLDALISVTNDEDLEHMMLEYDRLLRGSAKPARLRLFLFPVISAPPSFATGDPKSERQWFVDALNSVQLEGSSPPAAAAAAAAAAAGNPDFLFGLDKGFPVIPAAKFQDSAPAQTVPDVVPTKDMSAGSDCGSEDRHVVSDPQLMSQAEIQRQIHELQRMQIANQEQAAMYQRKSDEINPRAYVGDYYTQKVPEKIAPAPVPVPVQMQIPPTYMPERHMTTAGGVYPMAAAPGAAEHQMYLIQTPTGVYQAVRPVNSPVNQNYYGVQRVVQETYREQPVYNAVAQQGKIVGGAYNEGNIPVMQQQQQQQQQQMYYTTQGGGVMAAAASYQTVAPVAVDSRQGGGGGGGGGVVLNQEGKVVTKAS